MFGDLREGAHFKTVPGGNSHHYKDPKTGEASLSPNPVVECQKVSYSAIEFIDDIARIVCL